MSKILFLQTFIFRTLQEHFVFIEKKRKMYVDARGNVNRERKELHRQPAGLHSGGTSFLRKLLPYGPERGKVNREDCILVMGEN